MRVYIVTDEVEGEEVAFPTLAEAEKLALYYAGKSGYDVEIERVTVGTGWNRETVCNLLNREGWALDRKVVKTITGGQA